MIDPTINSGTKGNPRRAFEKGHKLGRVVWFVAISLMVGWSWENYYMID